MNSSSLWNKTKKFIALSSDELAVSPFNRITDFNHPLVNGHAPEWASGWGQDEYGVFVEIAVQRVVQRLRWIAPGQFMMGSPVSEHGKLAKKDNEKEWFEREAPQHQVIMDRGYWLFDTPVTQALWQAVMDGENPSRFKSPQRPVEQVSWDDAVAFIGRLNAMIPSLDLALPTEAQWEYACRANSSTATYNGDLSIKGLNNAAKLNDIAWYGGNSGVNFDLDEGEDSRAWSEKQFNHQKAGTHHVALKRPNDWGLYDMLGNVWEWCDDGLRDYDSAEMSSPLGAKEVGVSRVLRGGGWISSARRVRAASRRAGAPDSRYSSFGFRCARVQDAER